MILPYWEYTLKCGISLLKIFKWYTFVYAFYENKNIKNTLAEGLAFGVSK